MRRVLPGLLLGAGIGVLVSGIAIATVPSQILTTQEGIDVAICQRSETVYQVDVSIDPEAFVGAPTVEEAATPQGIRPDGTRLLAGTSRTLTRGTRVAIYEVSQLPSGGFIITSGYYCDRDGVGLEELLAEFPSED